MGVFTSKLDANFYVWNLKEPRMKSVSYSYSSIIDVYEVEEVSLLSTTKDPKLFKKFIEEKIKDIKKYILQKDTIVEMDKSELAKLNKELEYYQNVI